MKLKDIEKSTAAGRALHKKKGKRKIRLSFILSLLVFLAGLSLLLYPAVSDFWQSRLQAQAAADYRERAAAMEAEETERLLQEARAYNQELAEKEERFFLTEEEQETYNSLLSVEGTEAIGTVEIPSIQVYLPIYHGTSDEVLRMGVGHLEGTSLPVGGEGTHSVISGHRGLPSASLFTELDEMEEGDIFVLTVLGETLTYEVDQILTIEPDELEALAIEEGKDYCTLMTCTPYGVNTHRLLVRGHRVPSQETVTEESPLPVLPIVAAAALILGGTLFFLAYRKKQKDRRKGKQGQDRENQ